MTISLESLPPDFWPEDPAALRDMILAQQQKIAGMEAANRALEALIQALKLTIARLKRQRYGSNSEKIDREIAQLELALEGLEMAGAAADPAPETGEADSTPDAAATEQRLPPRRRGKPRIAADAPREVIILDPGARCPDCGGTLRLVAEDVAEILDFIAAKLKVIEVPPAKEVLPRLRAHGADAGPVAADPAWLDRAVALGAHPGREVRRSRSALSPGRDLRANGR